MGYLCRISILGYDLKSYPDYQKISLHILSYPIISFHILSYPIISSGANSQMPLGVWNGSQNCAGASCVPDVIHLICQNIAFTDLTHRYWYIHYKDMYTHVTYMYVSFQFGKYTSEHIVDMYIQCLGRVSNNFVYTSKYLVYTC